MTFTSIAFAPVDASVCKLLFRTQMNTIEDVGASCSQATDQNKSKKLRRPVKNVPLTCSISSVFISARSASQAYGNYFQRQLSLGVSASSLASLGVPARLRKAFDKTCELIQGRRWGAANSFGLVIDNGIGAAGLISQNPIPMHYSPETSCFIR